jgi:hypothetical protein
MNTQDPIARLGALAPEDRAWILAGLSPQARDELLRRTRGALAGGGTDDQAAGGRLDAESQQCLATVDDRPSITMLTERLCSTPLNALVDVLAGEPIWLTAALLRASDWPWRAQLLQRLPQVALYLTPSLDPAGAALSASLAQSLLQRIADKAASMPAPVTVTKFEMLVQKIAARRVAAWRSI